MEDISRRSFLQNAALAGAAAASAGLVCTSTASADEAEAEEESTGEAEDAEKSSTSTQYSWEVAPDPITDVIETVDTDVLIIGAGLSGCACAASAAENGAEVTVVEKTSSWNGRGGGFGAIGSHYMDEQGITVDKVSAKQHWLARCGNRVNEDLVTKFLNNSEDASNWFLAKAEELGASAMILSCYSHDDVFVEQPGYHMLILPEDTELTSSGFAGAEILCNDAISNGATFVYDSPAVQLIQDDSGAVTGCICETDAGYVQYNAKGVVLCTGDIGGNLEMCEAYAPICVEYGQPRSQYTPVGVNTGDGHQMGMWVGAQLQDLPLPTAMHPQAYCWFHAAFMFVNDNGERFMNEDTWVQAKSVSINRQPNGEAWSIFDANWETDLTNGLPYGGGMFWDSFREEGSDVSEAAAYYEAVIPTYVEAGLAYQEDTIEALAADIGCDAETLQATIDRYNEMCDAGVDTDYYKQEVYLTPIREAPYYALKVGPALLVVTGGLKVDTNCQCLDAEGEAIPGLYALGNCQGDITAIDYPINISGNSHGRCITFGYLLGRYLAGVEE